MKMCRGDVCLDTWWEGGVLLMNDRQWMMGALPGGAGPWAMPWGPGNMPVSHALRDASLVGYCSEWVLSSPGCPRGASRGSGWSTVGLARILIEGHGCWKPHIYSVFLVKNADEKEHLILWRLHTPALSDDFFFLFLLTAQQITHFPLCFQRMWRKFLLFFPVCSRLLCFLSSALALAFSAIGATETMTGTKSLCYLLFIWKCSLLRICVCWLAVHRSMFICACLHEWLLILVFPFFRKAQAAGPLFFLFHSQINIFPCANPDFNFPFLYAVSSQLAHKSYSSIFFFFFAPFRNREYWNSLEWII